MRQSSPAFTLIEMVMAMAITAAVGLSIAGVSSALSSAYADSEYYYQELQTGRSAMMRIASLIRQAKLVTNLSATQAGLWMDDTDASGSINPPEMRYLMYDSKSRQVRLGTYVYPANLSPNTLATLTASQKLSTMTQATTLTGALNSSYMSWTVLATDVRAFSLAATGNPPMTTAVAISMTVGGQPKPVTLRATATLRAPKLQYVGVAGSTYVLSTQNLVKTAN